MVDWELMENRKTWILEMLQRTPNRDTSVLYIINTVQKSLLTLSSALASALKTSFAVLHEFAKPS